MPWQRTKPFNNYLHDPAGVCEAAVSLWGRRIRDRIGRRNLGRSAGDWVPREADAHQLNQDFANNPDLYPVSYATYLSLHVTPGGFGHPGDVDPQGFNVIQLGSCNFSNNYPNQTVNNIVTNTARGDFLFLAYLGGAVGHAVGLYRGSDYVFVFDPNRGLFKGRGWDRNFCLTHRPSDLHHAVNCVDQIRANLGHNTILVYGIHLRRPG
ncbi:MAG: hypothetical protein AAGC60_25775 [Acidobacteriota bacterium]